MSYCLILDRGPCEGEYVTARAPALLKATLRPPGRKGAAPRCDVLDLPDDEPRQDEEVHLYRRESAERGGIICGRSGCLRIVRYRYVRQLVGQLALARGN